MRLQEVLLDKRVVFYGNANINTKMFEKIAAHSDATVICTGAHVPRKLDIPGEEHVMSSTQFIDLYNSRPGITQKIGPHKRVVIIGHGNVSLDVCRVLLNNVERLRPYEFSRLFLQELACSPCHSIYLIGRSGPFEVLNS